MLSRAAIVLGLWVAVGCDGTPPSMSGPDAAGPMADAPPPGHTVAYVSGYSPNIAWYDVDPNTGALTMAGQIAAFASSPSFLAIRTDTHDIATHLYAVSESTSRVGAYSIDQTTGALTFINDVPTGGDGPAHVSLDRSGAYVFVANYGDGTVSVVPLRADGGLMGASQTVIAGANAHQVLADPYNMHVLVPCKGSDFIAVYDFSNGMLTPSSIPNVMTAGGAGPRHIAWGHFVTNLYLVNENASTVTAYDYQAAPAATPTITPLETESSRAGGATGTNTGAEIVVEESSETVFVSNRGDNNIGVFHGRAGSSLPDLSLTGHVATGGQTPRMIALNRTWLYAANQDSNTVTTFELAPITRMPMPIGAPLSFTKPSFIGFANLPPQP